MKLSIIIPVYNAEKTLARCLESVFSQSFDDYETIIVNDGSTDKSDDIIQDYLNKHANVKVIRQPNGGLSSARNSGIGISSGEYITFIDSDDTIGKGTLENLMDILACHPEYDILEYPVYVYYNSDKEHLLSFKPQVYTDMKEYWLRGEAYRHSYAWNKIYRKSIFKDIEFPVGKVFEDIWTLPRLLRKATTVATTDKGTYYYYATPYGITATASGADLYQLLMAHKTVMDELEKIPLEYYVHVANIQLDVYESTGEICIGKYHTYIGRWRFSVKELLKIICLKTLGIKNLCRIQKYVKSRL